MQLAAAREIRPITGLRGAAALYVVLFHYLGTPFSNPITTTIAHGYLAVDVFFVISGFVMALKYGYLFTGGFSAASYRVFLGRRVARVYPLYVCATCAALIFVRLGFLPHRHGESLGVTFALNLALVQVWGGDVQSLDGPSWSISAECVAYLLFPLLLVPTLQGRVVWSWAIGLLATAVIATLCSLPAAVIHDRAQPQALLDVHAPYFALPVLRCLAEFVLGLLAYRLASTSFGKLVAGHRGIAPLLYGVMFALLATPGSDLGVVLLAPLLVMATTSENHLPGRIFASPPAMFFGMLSYSIYLIHDLFGRVINRLHDAAHSHGIAHAQAFAATAGAVATLGLAYLAYVTIEAPGRAWVRAALHRPESPTLSPRGR